MADGSPIEWTDATWNPTVGCTIVSPGCTNCYAMKVANGLERRFDSPKYRGLTKVVNGNAVWTGEVRLDEAALLQPLKWKRGRRIFVNSMSDLFHESLSDADIDRVFAVMALCPQHTFQVLTKRAERMQEYLSKITAGEDTGYLAAIDAAGCGDCAIADGTPWPLPNVWLGVSAERQEEADERIPLLLDTPAAVRFVSAEPLLGPIAIGPWLHDSDCDLQQHGAAGTCTCTEPREACLDWIIVGGESGPRARPMHPQWARDIRDQCTEAGVPFFFKQWGEWTPGENVERDRGVVATAHWFDNQWSLSSENLANHEGHVDDQPDLYRVGKKAAGRSLDGREHNAFPVTDVSVVQPALASHENKNREATRA